MKHIMLLSIMILTLVSCTGDEVRNNSTIYTSTGIQLALECDNYDAIYEDISYLIGESSYVVSDISFNKSADMSKACEVIVSGLAHTALKKGVPEDWGCRMNNAGRAIDYVSKYVCDRMVGE